ncbi:hypothetical protein [Flavobacterium sp. 245]|uniref:hypothetical protein n=1 Tax=Flavobacterium sp. 245 TaxID=2512115 RepID=UPI00105F38CB|nr:hypothetical protein [Flavobacterium sp. 245]TDP03198.1 hypothetical protein EV145_102361 [Flavobacterium sp. 245]
MITYISENSLVDIILLTFIVLGFAVCLFIFRRTVLTFRKEKINGEASSMNSEKQLIESEKY